VGTVLENVMSKANYIFLNGESEKMYKYNHIERLIAKVIQKNSKKVMSKANYIFLNGESKKIYR